MPWARAAVRSWVRPGCRAGEPQPGAVRTRDDLHVHAVLAVFLGVVRLVRVAAVDGDQRAVDDDEVPLAQADEGLLQAGRPGGQDLESLVHVPPGGRGGDPEPRRELRQRLVLAQMHQRQQGLLKAAQLAPPRAAFTPSGMDQPRNVLDQLMRDVERGTIRDQAWCVENTTATTRSLAPSHHPADLHHHPCRTG